MQKDQLDRGKEIQKELTQLTKHRQEVNNVRQIYINPSYPGSGYSHSESHEWPTAMTMKNSKSDVHFYDQFIAHDWDEFIELYLYRLDRRVRELEAEFNSL